MPIECPVCGSRNLRHSHYRGLRERFYGLLGVHPLRCRECRARFTARTWEPSDFKFARCPRCLRQDLSRWSIQDYDPPASTRLALALGARPYRCPYCRHNFAGFRARKERYGDRKLRQSRIEEPRT